ncbi:MAG: esterase/lipase family protein [Actinomycetes bacterium]
MTAGPDRRAARRRGAALLAVTEPVRTLAGAGALAASFPLLRTAPRGVPHPVLVLPGLLTSDLSTKTLRSWVNRLGHPVAGWALGRNRGPSKEINDELPALVARLAAEHGAPVSVIGWSLGGVFARRLARRAPRQVRQVISLGTPLSLPGRRPGAGAGGRVYRRFVPLQVVDGSSASTDALPRPLPVPSTAVYSRWDGVVDWRACRQQPGPISENVAVRSSHLGMTHDPAVLWIVADRLALPPDAWRPFERPTRFGLGALFPSDD